MKMIMDEDAAIAGIYQETYSQIKSEKEVDIDRIEAVHDRFDYFKNPDNLQKKIKDERFDRHEADADTSDECFTTDFSDMEANDVYRRFKLLSKEAKDDHRMLESKYQEYKLALKNQKVLEKGDKNAQRPWRDLERELYLKKFNTSKYAEKIEGYLANMRMMSHHKKMHHTDILKDGDGEIDPILEGTFNPYERLSEEAKNNPNLAPELRKLLNKNEPEKQEVQNPITDEESARAYTDNLEVQNAYFQAKWQWYVDKKLSQVKLTMRDIEAERAHAQDYDEWIE